MRVSKLAIQPLKRHISDDELHPLARLQLGIDRARTGIVFHTRVVRPSHAAEMSGLARGLSGALEPWRAAMAVFDPGQMLVKLAPSVAVGGDCVANVRELAGAEAIVGPVPSAATTSRLISAQAADVDRVEAITHQAIQQVWTRTCGQSPLRSAAAADPILVDIYATLITAHSDKLHTAPTYKKDYWHHPLLAFCDHGPGGSGEPARWAGAAQQRRVNLHRPQGSAGHHAETPPGVNAYGLARGCWCAPIGVTPVPRRSTQGKRQQ